jgi:hypothetical protein
MSGSGNPAKSGRRSKIVRLLDEYDLQGLGAKLERLWTATGDDRMSLRDLAELFNTELLRAALAEVDTQPLDGEIENMYRLLTDEEVTEADRTRAVRRLERRGIDVEQLERDFVTYQAIRSYLTEHRDASYASERRDRTETEQDSIQQFRGRMLTVIDSKLDQLERNGDLTLGEYQTLVDINVLCEECGAQYGIDELLDRGGCDCDRDSEHTPPSSGDG